MAEQYFFMVSYPRYEVLHHELANFNIKRPVLDDVAGLLSSFNQAMAYMIVCAKPDWGGELSDVYDLKNAQFGFMQASPMRRRVAFFRVLSVPSWIHSAFFKLDWCLARTFPRIFASSFSVELRAELCR
ncbi:hypothetical protein [Bradyrhizobium ivorense]|uniref:hypothetical protein n=1 Tax=Bradyrhizobium ivorense TaxID=2511166 RepID=UPI0010BA9B0F|nr:hypothetical protein [Bradyrhizobium ivorense]VIO69837.1 hypothetical protein CI41S_20840 [Bradyrhizobium ivorense]